MSLLLQALQGETPDRLPLQELSIQEAVPDPQGGASGTDFSASREQTFSAAFRQPAPAIGNARPGLGIVLVLVACLGLAGAGVWYGWSSPQAPAIPAKPTPAAAQSTRPQPADGLVQDQAVQSLSGPPVALAPIPENKPVVTGMEAPEIPHIEHHADMTEVHPLQEAAWLAYQSGENADAEALYRQMLVRDAENREAQLGLAALAMRRGWPEEAAQHYRQLLARTPGDPDALAGLLAAMAPLQDDSLLARLQQTGGQAGLAQWLGQHLAAGERWHEARTEFFNAFRLAPDNAVLAFNLAVSLEHTSEARLAAHYYGQALRLDGEGLVRAQAERRLAEMETP